MDIEIDDAASRAAFSGRYPKRVTLPDPAMPPPLPQRDPPLRWREDKVTPHDVLAYVYSRRHDMREEEAGTFVLAAVYCIEVGASWAGFAIAGHTRFVAWKAAELREFFGEDVE